MFDQDDGEKVKDASGRGNYGKIAGARWAQDESGNGVLEFNGAEAHVDIPLNNTDIPTEDLTFS